MTSDSGKREEAIEGGRKETKSEKQLLTWGCVTAETVSANLLMFT